MSRQEIVENFVQLESKRVWMRMDELPFLEELLRIGAGVTRSEHFKNAISALTEPTIFSKQGVDEKFERISAAYRYVREIREEMVRQCKDELEEMVRTMTLPCDLSEEEDDADSVVDQATTPGQPQSPRSEIYSTDYDSEFSPDSPEYGYDDPPQTLETPQTPEPLVDYPKIDSPSHDPTSEDDRSTIMNEDTDSDGDFKFLLQEISFDGPKMKKARMEWTQMKRRGCVIDPEVIIIEVCRECVDKLEVLINSLE